MKIVVCIKQLPDGEINPFDACALEAALSVENSEITLLSMGRQSAKEMLLSLTRLGDNVNGILLSDIAFAGADTLATGYALSLAIKKINPDLVICGRQSIDGDTAQTGPQIAAVLQMPLITNVLELNVVENAVDCKTRLGNETACLPALVTVERINSLRFPSLRSKTKNVTVYNADDLGADKQKCGLKGSPTKVVKSFENNRGKRKCQFISPDELDKYVAIALQNEHKDIQQKNEQTKLETVCVIGEKPLEIAKNISENVKVIEPDTAENLAKKILSLKADFVLWPSDLWGRKVAPQVAAMLQTGLCADCTLLETDGTDLFMYRPALSGNVIAKIVCSTKPVMATVRTTDDNNNCVVVSAGKGVKNSFDKIEKLAKTFNAEITASRGIVDLGLASYEQQVGLTGKTIAPKVYIACGISGAVHHIVGMEQSETIIAINSDKNAPIFEYSDYGIVASIDDII